MDNYCKLWCNSYRLWIIYHIIHWKNHTSPATLLSIANFFPNMSGQSPEKSGLRRFLPTLAKLNQLFIPKILMFLGLNHDFTNMFKHGVRWLFRFRSPFFSMAKTHGSTPRGSRGGLRLRTSIGSWTTAASAPWASTRSAEKRATTSAAAARFFCWRSGTLGWVPGGGKGIKHYVIMMDIWYIMVYYIIW